MDAARTLRSGDGSFPASLARIARSPASLRVRGDLGRPVRRVAVVGTRHPDEYGRETAGRLSRGLARAGISIVSGGALGIDAAAHEGALAVGGHTVAVLGCGVDVVQPPSHRALFERILEAGGALVSEYQDGTPAARWTFPERNRIIAGLSDAVVVVRAGPRSGALITARWARAQGVPVLAVPGDVDQELSAGGIELLRAGARVAAGPEDVLGLLGVAPGSQGELPLPAAPADPAARACLDALGAGARHLDELARAAGIGTGVELAALLGLELEGLVEQRPGHYFLRRAA